LIASLGNTYFSCTAPKKGTLFAHIEAIMLNSLRCRLKGHLFVDSRSLPGMQTCVRCRLRQPFESVVGALGYVQDKPHGSPDVAA
jgi:hypothetical protein